jgi:chitin synthase
MFTLVLDIFAACPWQPSTVSMELTVGAFLLVGLLHPAEAAYLLHGVVYYLTIPCMYMLLPLYCVFNLDDVSWGTRDSARPAEAAPPSGLASLSRLVTAGEEVGRLEAALVRELAQLRAAVETRTRSVPVASTLAGDAPDGLQGSPGGWARALGGEAGGLEPEEERLWGLVTHRHLRPTVRTEQQAAEMKEGLLALKTEIFLLFLFLNAAWAFGIFLMQLSSLESSAFTLDWLPCQLPADPVLHLQLNSTAPPVEVTYTALDPINFVFIAFFLLVLLIQVVGMLFHRVRTVGHIVATTDIFPSGPEPRQAQQFHQLDVSMVRRD